MTSIWEYLEFRDPIILAIALALIAMLMMTVTLRKVTNFQRQYILIISFVAGLIMVYGLYTNSFYGFERALAILIYLAVAAFFLKILFEIVRRGRRAF